MSLTRRNDGCPECRNRRLRCDKTEPECLKCIKKGLKCSGQGFECRFSSHMAKLPAAAKQSIASVLSTSSVSKPKSASSSSSPPPPRRRERERGSVSKRLPPARSGPGERLAADSGMTLLADSVNPVQVWEGDEEMDLVICPTLQPLSLQRRRLFEYFSENIASKMVIYDWGITNGYRTVLLPLAYQDETVARAICAVSAFHMGTNSQDMLATAETTQHAVLTQLLRDSMNLNPSRVFSLTTWAAILVLLVGDTITGSTNYILSLAMLRHLVSSATADPSMPENARMFLYQQTKMFEFFGSPLTSERSGLETLSKPIDHYLDFFATISEAHSDTERVTKLQLIRSAIIATGNMCIRRIRNPSTYECPPHELDSLKKVFLRFDLSAEGEHALVWSCFIAASESVLPEHREFFYGRLAHLYGHTRFGTITKALEMMGVIWEKQGRQKWTEFVTLERPLLVM